MDPQVTWDEMLRAFACQDWTEVGEHADALSGWLSRGGFPPAIIADPPVGNPFNAAMARATCKFALAEARARGWSP